MVERAKASKLAYLPVASFIQNTASRAATPGGGTVAALSGSLGAGLLMMVCRLTLGKKKYQHLEAAMRDRVEKLMPMRDRLKELTDEDSAAFDHVMVAYGMAQESEADKRSRDAAIAEAYAGATRVPLEVMRLCLEGLELGTSIAAEGSENALSDAAVAGLMLLAGLHGAAYNVRINLPEVTDGALRKEAEQAVASWPTRANELAATLRLAIEERMPG